MSSVSAIFIVISIFVSVTLFIVFTKRMQKNDELIKKHPEDSKKFSSRKSLFKSLRGLSAAVFIVCMVIIISQIFSALSSSEEKPIVLYESEFTSIPISTSITFEQDNLSSSSEDKLDRKSKIDIEIQKIISQVNRIEKKSNEIQVVKEYKFSRPVTEDDELFGVLEIDNAFISLTADLLYKDYSYKQHIKASDINFKLINEKIKRQSIKQGDKKGVEEILKKLLLKNHLEPYIMKVNFK